MPCPYSSSLFFFNDTATTEIYTLSLHDALPISLDPARRTALGTTLRQLSKQGRGLLIATHDTEFARENADRDVQLRSEEHTSELQSLTNLVCRLLLEKKKKRIMCAKAGRIVDEQ